MVLSLYIVLAVMLHKFSRNLEKNVFSGSHRNVIPLHTFSEIAAKRYSKSILNFVWEFSKLANQTFDVI